MKFQYQAKDINGNKKSGTIDARSREEVLSFLSSDNLFPIEVVEQVAERDKPVMERKITFFEGVSMKDVAVFSRQLSIMIDSNVPPAEAIEALGDQTRNAFFKERIHKIAKDVREGTQLSKALKKYPDIFSVFYVNMIRSGEVSGSLPGILQKVASHLENEYEIKSKVTGAMIYPGIILIVFVLIFAVIMIFIIPGLVEVLQEAGSELPLATRIIMGISSFFVHYWYLALLLLGGIIVFFVQFPKTKTGKDFFDRLIINMPVLGNFFKSLFQSRFAENFSTLLGAGITINEALEVVANLIGNNVYKEAILEAQADVVKGESISVVLSRRPDIMSPLLVQMVSVGEKTGKLDSSLENVVRFYKRETDNFINSLSSIIEPLLIIGLALMVGLLVAAVLLPIYQVSTSIK
ncbi:MAG: type II secretion system F family protein [Candidatus Paceibacterota bacterium]|jgi:type IV pilus assembly protein PilC